MVDLTSMDLQTIPAGRGVAIELSSGSKIIVINTHGTQVLDTWAFNLDDPSEYMSMEHTRSRLSRLSPRARDNLFSNRRRPILKLVEDTSPGIHDTLLCACNKEIYRELGCDDGHRSCESNLHEALSFIGLEIAVTPGPLTTKSLGATPGTETSNGFSTFRYNTFIFVGEITTVGGATV